MSFTALKLWPLPQFVSQDGINQIKSREACRLTAYRDGGGRWTIGYGRAYGVYGGETITQEQADHFLSIDVLAALNAVHREVHTPLSQPSVDALVSFIYNVGPGAFARSDALRHINAGELDRVPTDLEGWCYVNGKPDAGLLRRRRSEAAQFAY